MKKSIFLFLTFVKFVFASCYSPPVDFYLISSYTGAIGIGLWSSEDSDGYATYVLCSSDSESSNFALSTCGSPNKFLDTSITPPYDYFDKPTGTYSLASMFCRTCPEGQFSIGFSCTSCPSGYSWNGTMCSPNCGQNETFNSSTGQCDCFPNMTRDGNGQCSSCSAGMNLFGNGVCYYPCPSGWTESSNMTTRAQICTNPNPAMLDGYINPDGSYDVLRGDGSRVRYSKSGYMISAWDSSGNPIAPEPVTPEYYLANPRGTFFNPIIAGGLFGSGYLITSAGILASGVAGSGFGLPLIWAGVAVLYFAGGVAAVAIHDPSSPSGTTSGGTSGGTTSSGGTTINIQDFDTSSASGGGGATLEPISVTANANGSTTKVYKPNSSTTISQTEYYDGVVDYQIQDNTTGEVKSYSVNKNDLGDKGATTLQPPQIPITEHAVTDKTSVSGSNNVYQPDIATGGYIPYNPQTSTNTGSGGGSTSTTGDTTTPDSGTTSGGTTSGDTTGTTTSGGTTGSGDTSGGSTSGGTSTPAGGTTSGSGTSSGGSMTNGQTSGAAGTDGNTSGDGSGKDFGDGFGDFSTFKSWDDILSALDGLKSTVTGSFKSLNDSLKEAKDSFGTDKIKASVGSGSSCSLSFSTSFGSSDLTDGMSRASIVFKPFISVLVFISLLALSAIALFKTLRGGVE